MTALLGTHPSIRPMANRSPEFYEGYRASKGGTLLAWCPYPASIDEVDLQKFLDWREGWKKRFYGENIESNDVDP